MAFKKLSSSAPIPESPADLFKTLTRRMHPAVMPHQRDILDSYSGEPSDKADVALQLPTGSGKTLVGLLIGEWRRRKFDERIVYLCPTVQLVNQTVQQAQNQYGLDVTGFTGSKHNYSASDKSDYLTGQKVAVTTYSSLFNTSPFFDTPDTIIIDDAHAAENYIANMWSFELKEGISEHNALFIAFCDYLKPHLSVQDYARLTGEWEELTDASWVEKLPSSILQASEDQLVALINTYVENIVDLNFKWLMLRDHLDACHVYLGPREILIRPLIPPTWSHKPFNDAKHRIFMSATLGDGGDLERLTGRKSIHRLPAPEGFEQSGVGRRFFMFPGLSLEQNACEALRLKLLNLAGRSVVLTPSQKIADKHTEAVQVMDNMKVYTVSDIEVSKEGFLGETKATAIMAGRFDGIDFPHDECRLLCLDGLPRAMNAQERFLMSKMGAVTLFNERIQTRILQAAGRCTRALQDQSAVYVTGRELLDYLVDKRNYKHFHPELQAELTFGAKQSKDMSEADFVDNFRIFLENGDQWANADASIRAEAEISVRTPYPAMATLSKTVSHEIRYQQALWSRDYENALAESRSVLTELEESELRGYRALWHYLSGSAAQKLSINVGDSYDQIAKQQFNKAKKAAPSIVWLSKLTHTTSQDSTGKTNQAQHDLMVQVERIETVLLNLGTADDRAFEKKAKSILEGLNDAKKFEEAHRMLGELLGFIVGNVEEDASPDPWWLGESQGFVFEDHANASQKTVVGANKARQAASHPNWIRENVLEAATVSITPVLVTPCMQVKEGAKPHLRQVRLWNLDEFRSWAKGVIGVIRSLKSSLPPESDLEWRSRAASTLEVNNLTATAIVNSLPLATDIMEVVS